MREGFSLPHFYLFSMSALELYNREMENYLKVNQIFEEFFGEDKVDMQDYPTYDSISEVITERTIKRLIPPVVSILVHFPHVTVTNEHDKSTEIDDLFAKVRVLKDGTLAEKFSLNRSSYSYLHISNGYMHSHIHIIPFGDFGAFQTPCTGSGPINHTMGSLFASFDEDLWRLFCLELDKFVRVESLTGVPYHRLENLSLRTTFNYDSIVYPLRTRLNLPNEDRYGLMFAKFTKYLVDKNILKFRYTGKSYSIGTSAIETIILISNCFIEWYNREFAKNREHYTLGTLSRDHILLSCKYTGTDLLVPSSYGRRITDYSNYVGSLVCTFKGREMRLQIDGIPQNPNESNTIIVLNRDIIESILTRILNIINLRYGNTECSDESAARNVQTVRII